MITWGILFDSREEGSHHHYGQDRAAVNHYQGSVVGAEEGGDQADVDDQVGDRDFHQFFYWNIEGNLLFSQHEIADQAGDTGGEAVGCDIISKYIGASSGKVTLIWDLIA